MKFRAFWLQPVLAAVLAIGLTPVPASASSITTISEPDADYVASTAKFDFSGLTNWTNYTSVSAGDLAINFDLSMSKRSVPSGGWGVWASPPYVESSTPHALAQSTPNTPLTMTLSKPVKTFGFELCTGSSTVSAMTVEFFSGTTSLGSITRDVQGAMPPTYTDGGARLFAATVDGDRIDKVMISGEAISYAIAQVRYDYLDILVLRAGLDEYWDPTDFSRLGEAPGTEAWTKTNIYKSEVPLYLTKRSDVLVLPDEHNYSTAEWYSADNVNAIVSWVGNGGRLIVQPHFIGQSLENDYLMAAFGPDYRADWTGERPYSSFETNTVIDAADPLVSYPNALTSADLSNWRSTITGFYTVSNSIDPETAGPAWHWVVQTAGGNYWLGWAQYGEGVIIIQGNTLQAINGDYGGPKASWLIENEVVFEPPETTGPAPTVSGIAPGSGLNTGTVGITDLSGTGFAEGATVKLTKTGQPDIAGTDVAVVSTSQITCSFDLSGAAAGEWNVVVTNPDGQSGTLADGFAVQSPYVAPFFTSPDNTIFVTGSENVFTVSAAGSPAPALDRTGPLPAGITFVDNGDGTATLGGTPEAGTGDTYALTFSATNTAGSAGQAFTLTVNEAPAVTDQPDNQELTAGQTAGFSAAATGYPAPEEQWQVLPPGGEWTDIPGAEASPYTFTAQLADNGNQYRAVFTNTAGSVSTDPATLTVKAANAAPVALEGTAEIAEDTPSPVTLTATDADAGDILTYSIVDGPSHGSLSAMSGNPVTYTPNADYNGPDGFTFRANDGKTDSNTATVSITVTAVNDAPVANDDVLTVEEDSGPNAVDVLANDSILPDVGETLTITAVTQGTNGTVAIRMDIAGIAYIPDANYAGPDSFTYTVSDGNGGTATATVSVTVTAVNDPPVAVDDAHSTAGNTALTVPAPGVLGNDNDIDSTTLTAVKTSDPTNGTVTLNADGSFTYTPDTGFTGTDSFTYQADDGNAGSNTATVTVTVLPTSHPPVAAADSYSTSRATTLSVAAADGVLNNDADPQAGTDLTATLVKGCSNGILTLNSDGSFAYTPKGSFTGRDSFTYKASDGTDYSNEAAVTIMVNVATGTLAITAPSDGEPVSGPVTVAVSNSIEVRYVEFFADGKSIGRDSAAPFENSWDTTRVADGWHNLSARALTATGQTLTAATVNVKVVNGESGVAVALTQPSDGDTVTSSATITASVTGGGVQRIEFLVDGRVIARDTLYPYEYTWNAAKNQWKAGWHMIAARAVDANGNQVLSMPVRVYIAK